MDFAHDFADFMTKATCSYQFIEYARPILISSGYVELQEGNFPDEMPKKGFFVRSGRALLAYNNGGFKSCVAMCAHDDSPHLKLKPIFDDGTQLRVMNYAGGLSYSLFNRELKITGSAIIKVDDHFERRSFDSGKPIAFIPAPNEKYDSKEHSKIDREIDLNPIYTFNTEQPFIDYLSTLVDSHPIESFDCSLVDARPATIFGDFITSPRLDDLHCTYASFKSFLSSNATNTLNICCIFDSEEIGSNTYTGAFCSMLDVFLQEILSRNNLTLESFRPKCLLVSADAGHACHPSFKDIETGKSTQPVGKGPSIKCTTKTSYATEPIGAQMISEASRRAGVDCTKSWTFNGRRGGGTIGPKMSWDKGMRVVDVGSPQWAMHSTREMMAWKDVEDLTKIMETLYNEFESIFDQFECLCK